MGDLKLTIPTSEAVLRPQPTVSHPLRNLLTPVPDRPGEFLLVLDNSSLEVFTTCPTAARYKLVLRREAFARNAALVFGGALHEGLEKLLLGEPESVQDQAIHNFFLTNPPPTDEYRTLGNCLEVLRAYRRRTTLPDYQWELLSDAKGLIVERAFELPLGSIEVGAAISTPWLAHPYPFVQTVHVAWSGRIDAVASISGKSRIVDHKTTSIDGDSFIQDFQISNQVLGYVWAARQLWPDLAVSGFCLNKIRFKKPASGAGPDLTVPGPRGGEPALAFGRHFFDYSDQRISDWAINCLAIVSDFLNCLVRDYYPRHTKWCFGKYGKCSYHDVCVQDDERVRLNMLQSDMFKPVTWDPVKGR